MINFAKILHNYFVVKQVLPEWVSDKLHYIIAIFFNNSALFV